ncbi:type IV pilus biogenesis protein PilP [Salmonella enterica subsp. enterica serovar Lexington]|uniref:Type IV pilus biogenesis protein PilP n=2 Tax=Salmonella enterica TaxID=28901 RepID=A0A5Y5T970_SALER|nr:type IV pilus biogenesis protein PilP [Salmonella enterica subsp. enterica serovar Weltevreden]EAC0964217.1 type IV pilus biogenesis protein PilP [Salmonella enterica subsp. enterica serovar Newport]EAM2795167.1 type IV pilus biogenesis protein PilP [Salmonella enterica]EBR9008051.1 type IV pilus biogenesis protein PilP [Salmonella enterica subsp. enterica serovar Richmond]EBU7427048.1 type IV pilus biogenesis protein PilP [Salmonella enterica subsp. enterica serovar Lexington]EBU7738988.1 
MLRTRLIASLFLFPVLVHAEPPSAGPDTTVRVPPPSDEVTVSAPPTGKNVIHMEEIQAQTMLYKAQLLRDKALTELQKLSSGGDSPSMASAPLPYDTSATQSPPASSARDEPPPQVIQITGAGKTLSALIRLSGGNQLMVQAGNTIPGANLKVEKITFDAVTVSKPGKQAWMLAFAED